MEEAKIFYATICGYVEMFYFGFIYSNEIIFCRSKVKVIIDNYSSFQ